MATRSTIAVKCTDGKVRQIYCHNDGYPSHVGNILSKHYNTQEKAEALVNLGDASSINENLEPQGEDHSYEDREENVCVFYHRDREEDWEYVKPTESETYSEAQEKLSESYNYYFEDGNWQLKEK